MNWISILCQIFFCVQVTSVTGSFMLIIWYICRLFLEKWNPGLVYYMLRWVVVMFLLPVTYVALLQGYNASYVQQAEHASKMLFVVDANSEFQMGMLVLWITLAMLIMSIFGKGAIKKYRLCRMNFEDGESELQSEFNRIKEVLGIKGTVVLLRNDHPKLRSPFVTGLWKRKVVVPYRWYDTETIKVILYHELAHIKKSDILFRNLTMLAITINSINPLACLLLKEVTEWSERDCDAKAVEALEKEGISRKKYYKTIYYLMTERIDDRIFLTFPMLFTKRNSLYRRIEFMEKYKENLMKLTKPVTFVLVLMFAVLSSATAYGAGIGLANVTDAALKNTQKVGQDGTFSEENWSDEMLIPANDTVETIYINEGIMTIAATTFDWDVPAGTRLVSDSIYMREGQEVQIACTASPSTCTYWFGLMFASSECLVVEGSGSGSHTFTVPSNGYYRIMVENRSSQDMNVMGSYRY